MKRTNDAFRSFDTIFVIMNDVLVVLDLFEELAKNAKLFFYFFDFL